MHRRLSFCVEDASGCPLRLAAGGLNRFRRARLSGRGLLIILPIINSDCGARGRQFERWRTARPQNPFNADPLSILHPFSSLLSQFTATVCFCHAAFSVCGSLGTSGTVRSSDVNGLPQDRPLRLGRIDGQPEKVTVLTEIVFDICPSFYLGFIGAADVNFVC